MTDQPTLIDPLLQYAEDRRGKVSAEGTRSAYAWGLRHWAAYCGEEFPGRGAHMPPDDAAMIAKFAAWLAHRTPVQRAAGKGKTHYSPNSVLQWVNAIPWECDRLRVECPPMAWAHQVVARYKAERGRAGWVEDRKAPATVKQLRDQARIMVPANKARDLRDGCMTLVAFTCKTRESDLVGIDVEDVAMPDPSLLVVRVTSVKTSETRLVEIPRASDPLLCPVSWTLRWLRWLAGAGITSGPLFKPMGTRDGNRLYSSWPGFDPAVTRLSQAAARDSVKKWAARAGVDPSTITVHSYRRGGATASYAAGARAELIAKQGGWAAGSKALWAYIALNPTGADNPLNGVL